MGNDILLFDNFDMWGSVFLKTGLIPSTFFPVNLHNLVSFMDLCSLYSHITHLDHSPPFFFFVSVPPFALVPVFFAEDGCFPFLMIGVW